MLLFDLSDTSRKPKAGERENRMYAFTTRSKMEADIKAGRYLEHGEYDGNLYGTKIDSIHEVAEAGRLCILDVHPQVRLGIIISLPMILVLITNSEYSDLWRRCELNCVYICLGAEDLEDVRVPALCGFHRCSRV